MFKFKLNLKYKFHQVKLIDTNFYFSNIIKTGSIFFFFITIIFRSFFLVFFFIILFEVTFLLLFITRNIIIDFYEIYVIFSRVFHFSCLVYYWNYKKFFFILFEPCQKIEQYSSYYDEEISFDFFVFCFVNE